MRIGGLDKLKAAAARTGPRTTGVLTKLREGPLARLREWSEPILAHHTPPIGIDFGTSALKVLQVAAPQSQEDPPTLVAAALVETPEQLRTDPGARLRFQFEQLGTVIASGCFKGKRAAAAIPSAQTVCKPLRLQVPEGVELASLVAATLPVQLGCDGSQLVYRFVDVGQVGLETGAPKNEVVCIAAARDFVDRIIRAMRAANLDPVGMHNEYAATLHAFDSAAADDPDAGTLYLDIGAGTTKVMITHGKSMVFAKTIEIGGRHLDEAVAQQLGLRTQEEARARRLRMKSFGGGDRAGPSAPETEGMALLAAAMRRQAEAAGRAVVAERAGEPNLAEPLEMLTDEVSMCLRYHHATFPSASVESIVFTGGESRHLALCQHVARALKLKAQIGDPLVGVSRTGDEPTIGVELDGPQPGWTVALGLCLGPTDL
jgi:Tfp pilus assembly PilM family ATPase